MILTAFGRAIGQAGDPRFRAVVLRGVGLAVVLLGALTFACVWAIGAFVPDSVTLPFIGSIGGVDAVLSVAFVLVMLVASVVLMAPVASAISGFFLDEVADAVEARHYPSLGPPRRVPWGETVADGAGFFVVVLAVNLLGLVLWPFAGPLAPVIFWGLNGYLLGREFFALAALRRMDRHAARALARAHGATIWLAGTLMAIPLTVPLLNLVIPVLGAAAFTHLFHRLNRDG